MISSAREDRSLRSECLFKAVSHSLLADCGAVDIRNMFVDDNALVLIAQSHPRCCVCTRDEVWQSAGLIFEQFGNQNDGVARFVLL